MGKRQKFSITDRIRSFRFAFRGLHDLVTEEHNFMIHIAALVLVIAAGIILKISITEWLALVFVSSLVLISEAINTSIENLADSVSADENEKIRKVKDTAASAVLISAIAALITGMIVFIPYLIRLAE